MHYAVNQGEGVAARVDDEASRWKVADKSLNVSAAADHLSHKSEIASD